MKHLLHLKRQIMKRKENVFKANKAEKNGVFRAIAGKYSFLFSHFEVHGVL